MLLIISDRADAPRATNCREDQSEGAQTIDQSEGSVQTLDQSEARTEPAEPNLFTICLVMQEPVVRAKIEGTLAPAPVQISNQNKLILSPLSPLNQRPQGLILV